MDDEKDAAVAWAITAQVETEPVATFVDSSVVTTPRSRLIATFVERWQKRAGKEHAPALHVPLGSSDTHSTETERAWMLVDWLVREASPNSLWWSDSKRIRYEEESHQIALRELSPVVDTTSAKVAIDVVRAARSIAIDDDAAFGVLGCALDALGWAVEDAADWQYGAAYWAGDCAGTRWTGWRVDWREGPNADGGKRLFYRLCTISPKNYEIPGMIEDSAQTYRALVSPDAWDALTDEQKSAIRSEARGGACEFLPVVEDSLDTATLTP